MPALFLLPNSSYYSQKYAGIIYATLIIDLLVSSHFYMLHTYYKLKKVREVVFVGGRHGND